MSGDLPRAVAPARPRVRVPRAPYPGLRPFVDGEEALLFGRERQVKEVIDRLEQTHFVAIIGGSGSGKSSLIMAGVVPELRSFGIPGAGDFWVPMVCTPGTNTSQTDQARRANTPLARLARKFATLLRSRGTPEADASRLDDIVTHLRQELGLSTLVDRYTGELAAPPGPDPGQARFLFVVDQFEELFHPTNKDVADCRLLVERIIDHFFSPHERCYVVLTMRSEHLNDCAGFLELPDAINRSSYLVRRLDRQELKSAIVEPARRLLRLRVRREDPAARLPDDVEFEPAVVEQLLDDVQAITADPDHLPLLQHLLARLWRAASDRTEARLDLPDAITGADLARAVMATAAVPRIPVDEHVNVLRAALENWAQAVYAARGDDERRQIDGVLRNLAYKDPNTGAYTQQRIDVDDCARFLGPGRTRDDLYRLVSADFLSGADYLYWDDDNPARVTLKVSHESFIRGWAHFRAIIDADAEHFEKFVDLLLKCGEWTRNGRSAAYLLEAGDLRRVHDAGLEDVLARADARASWFRFLRLNRDGVRLARLEPDVDAFVRESIERQRAAQNREGRRRLTRRLAWIVALVAVPPLLFWTVVQGPVIARALEMFRADGLAKATRISAPPANYPRVGSAAPELGALLDAGVLLDRGQWRGGPMATANRWALGHLMAAPLVAPQAELIDLVAGSAEPTVNGSLRSLLETAVWQAPALPGDALPAGQPGSQRVPMATRRDDASCVVEQPAARPGAPYERPRRGHLFTARDPDNPKLGRSVFVPDPIGLDDDDVQVRAASVGAAGDCVSSQAIIRIPRFLDPDIAFDANLRHLVHTAADSRAPGAKSLTIYEIDWELTNDEGGRLVHKLPKVVLTDFDPAAQVALSAGRPDGRGPGLAVLETWRTTAGRAMTVGKQHWQIFSPQAQRLPDRDGDPRLLALDREQRQAEPRDDPRLLALRASPPGSDCAVLGARLAELRQTGFELTTFDEGDDALYCYAVARGRPPDASPKADQVVVAVYARPSPSALQGIKDEVPAPVASLPRFARVVPKEAIEWRVGKRGGALDGWIAAWGPDHEGAYRYIGAPWSTCALWRIGVAVLGQQDGQGRAADEKMDGQTCKGR